MSYLENFNINQKSQGFTDHLDPELTSVFESLTPVENHEDLILKSLQGYYDDLEDYINIQQALMRVQARVMENIKQCLQDL